MQPWTLMKLHYICSLLSTAFPTRSLSFSWNIINITQSLHVFFSLPFRLELPVLRIGIPMHLQFSFLPIVKKGMLKYTARKTGPSHNKSLWTRNNVIHERYLGLVSHRTIFTFPPPSQKRSERDMGLGTRLVWGCHITIYKGSYVANWERLTYCRL